MTFQTHAGPVTADTMSNRKTAPTDSDTIEVTPAQILSFVGANQEAYANLVERMHDKDPTFRAHVRSWCWGAFFFPINWLLYRRLWTSAAGYAFFVIVFSYLFPKATFPFYFIFASFAKGLYLSYAARTIRKITVLHPDRVEAATQIAKAGGVSAAAAWIAAAVEIVFFGWALFAFMSSGAGASPHVIYFVPK